MSSLGSFAGASFGGLVSAYGAYRANQQNIGLSREQMRFQERMSSSAHRREVKDLRAAGLNPILSATGGSGASTPPGAQPSSLKNPLGEGMASALSAAHVKKMNAETDVLKASLPKKELGGHIWSNIKETVHATEEAWESFKGWIDKTFGDEAWKRDKKWILKQYNQWQSKMRQKDYKPNSAKMFKAL